MTHAAEPLRSFIASFVAPRDAQWLAGRCAPLTNARAVPRQNLHVTLHFLGNIAASRAAEVAALPGGLTGSVERVRVREVAGFPSAARARVIVALLEPDETLERWHAALQRAWPTTGRARTYRPHITLYRRRSNAEAVEMPSLPELTGRELMLLPPAAYCSDGSGEGVSYRRISN